MFSSVDEVLRLTKIHNTRFLFTRSMFMIMTMSGSMYGTCSLYHLWTTKTTQYEFLSNKAHNNKWYLLSSFLFFFKYGKKLQFARFYAEVGKNNNNNNMVSLTSHTSFMPVESVDDALVNSTTSPDKRLARASLKSSPTLNSFCNSTIWNTDTHTHTPRNKKKDSLE